MPVPIPADYQDLLERPVLAAVVTVMPDGQPQATPVWFDYADGFFRFNSAEGRQKARNLDRSSKVTLLILDPADPYHWMEVRGHVAAVKRESEGDPAAREHINALSAKYEGIPVFSGSSTALRIMYFIEADRINVYR